MFDVVALLLERSSQATFKKMETVVELKNKDDNFHDKSLLDFYEAFQKSHSPFLSMIKTEENISLPEALKSKISIASNQLRFSQDLQSDIEKLLLKLYVSNSKDGISISMSEDNEFLIYVRSKGTYKNMLINGDGDIELLVIPSDKRKSYNKTFYREDGINFSKVVSTFNEMR